jgi:hypothetical protein
MLHAEVMYLLLLVLALPWLLQLYPVCDQLQLLTSNLAGHVHMLLLLVVVVVVAVTSSCLHSLGCSQLREASGDARLMNPIAFAESHPQCERNPQVRTGVAVRDSARLVCVC